MNPQSAPLLEVREVTKRFPGVVALCEVSLTLGRGEVLAVVGENGAGKSTLMKILAGEQQADSGLILLDGKPVAIASVNEATALGIALIHQELNLADNLDVAGNVFLGREMHRLGIADRNRMAMQTRALLERLGLDCSPEATVSDLPIGKQQMVEIAKALSANARILIMDEPTSSLTETEAERLFAVIADLRTQGVSIIYISHRLREVTRIADRVVVLRDGSNAGELTGTDITHEKMVRLMVGRDISQFYGRTSHRTSRPVLQVAGLRLQSMPGPPLSLSVCAGEVVGVAGLVGAGRTELARAIFGIDPVSAGIVRVGDSVLRGHSPFQAIRAGLALVPEDRKSQGLILEMAVRENVTLAGLRRWQRAGLIRTAIEIEFAKRMVRELGIRTPSIEQEAQYLSGGNQQKVVLAKWLVLQPKALVLDEPTRGVDVGAKEEIYRLIERLSASGVATLMISSEMQELIGVCDRVVVMHEGRIAGELQGAAVTEEAIMSLATGGRAA
ncbi:MAG: ribose import ATP-binding protein RbsA 2 [Fimbriimonadales bacterium]